MQIIFMGTPSYATTIFEKLLEHNYNIKALFTQPDKKVGRKQKITPPHIKQYCLDNGLSMPIYQPTTLKDNSMENIIIKMKQILLLLLHMDKFCQKKFWILPLVLIFMLHFCHFIEELVLFNNVY